MSFRATALRRRDLTGILLALFILPLMAQSDKKPVTNITFINNSAITTSMVRAPSFGSTTSGGGSNDSEWLKIEFHYSVTAPNPAANYLDQAEFKIWIEGRDLLAPNAPGADGVAVALTGTITYVNIPVGKDAFGVFYVHPNTLGRYSTKLGPSDFDRKFNIHMEATVNGAFSDNIDKNKETDKAWFTQLVPVPGQIFPQNKSPFVTTDTDRYPAIKLTGMDAGAPAAP